MTKEYQIINNKDYASLAKEISKKLNAGWEVTGGVAVRVLSDSGRQQVDYFQAIYRISENQ